MAKKDKNDISVINMIIQLEKACVNVDYFKKAFTELLEKSSELTEKLKTIYYHYYPDKKT